MFRLIIDFILKLLGLKKPEDSGKLQELEQKKKEIERELKVIKKVAQDNQKKVFSDEEINDLFNKDKK